MLCYNDISDFEFYVLTIALSIYLFILIQSYSKDKGDDRPSAGSTKEHFVEVDGEEKDDKPVYVEEEQLNQVTFPMFFALPTKIKEIIVPKWDYVIQSVSGNSGSGGQDDETQDITEQTFVQNKDASIVNPDDPKTVDKDKYNKVVNTYKTMDVVLNTVKTLDKDKYEIILQESA